MQETPDIPFDASHWAALLQPHLPSVQLNLDTMPPCELHELPHAPQLPVELPRVVSHPSSGNGLDASLQFPNPVLQIGAQLPVVHVVDAALPIEQARLHFPQCAVDPLELNGVSQPLELVASQLPQADEVQLMLQSPNEQDAVALGWPLGQGAHDVVEAQP